MCVEDEIPVSVVDLDVPVTAIDEVIDENLMSLSAYEAALLLTRQNEQDGSNKQIVDLQNKNNNARLSKKASITPAQTDQIQSRIKKEQIEKVTTSPGIKDKVEPDKQKLPETSQTLAMAYVTRSVQNVPESRLQPPPTIQSYSKEHADVDRALSVKAQNMISQNPVSRFGLKTFTVVPTRPNGSQTHAKSEGSLRIGAIKIDELGNMVTQRESREKYDQLDEARDDRDSPLLDKAKAFWSSAKTEDSAPTSYNRASIKTGEVRKPLENPKPLRVTLTQASEKSSLYNQVEPPNQHSGPSTNLASAVMKKLAVSDPAENIFFSEHRKNLTFLKPSRRTSSRYVASAITKYTGTSSSKVDGVQGLPESASAGHTQLTVQNDPRPEQAVSTHKALNAPANAVPFPAGIKLYANYAADKQEVSSEPQNISTGVSSTKTLNSSPVNSKPQQQAARISASSEPTTSSSVENMSFKKTPGNPLPPNSTINTTRPTVAKKPELHSLGLQASPFGPVKKFKPVVPKSVEKETSLHSSLMEAIQSGEGMERLRKVKQATLFILLHITNAVTTRGVMTFI